MHNCKSKVKMQEVDRASAGHVEGKRGARRRRKEGTPVSTTAALAKGHVSPSHLLTRPWGPSPCPGLRGRWWLWAPSGGSARSHPPRPAWGPWPPLPAFPQRMSPCLWVRGKGSWPVAWSGRGTHVALGHSSSPGFPCPGLLPRAHDNAKCHPQKTWTGATCLHRCCPPTAKYLGGVSHQRSAAHGTGSPEGHACPGSAVTRHTAGAQ